MRIALGYPVETQHIRQIEAAWPKAQIIVANQEALAESLHLADVFCGHAKVPVDWDGVVAQGRMKWIQSSAAGLDHCLAPSVVQSEIMVSSASGVLAKQVVDQTLTLLSGALRSLPSFFAAQQRREFIRRPTRDLFGARIGIIGLGGNGRLIARVLKALDTTVWATDWFPEVPCRDVDRILPANDVDELLPAVDALILAAPLTDATREMIDARRLALLPADAVLINVARGGLIVEDDLADALQSGQLWGAGLDVTAVEPLPQESRLWQAPNLLITPHVGGQRGSRIDDMTQLFCENLDRFRNGLPLINQVDKRLGFPHPSAILRRDEPVT
ncbi:MAG: D-2-hydroxyacid dehydrogenase [Planctomycetota bacterium]